MQPCTIQPQPAFSPLIYALAQGCVPGSHKANFEMPNEIVRIPTRDIGTEREGQRGDGIHPPVHNPSCPKGSMLIFLEATYHTTLPWTNKEHARRSLLYRYSPKYLHYASEQYATSQPDWVAELSEEQQAVLEPPYIYHHPVRYPLPTLTRTDRSAERGAVVLAVDR